MEIGQPVTPFAFPGILEHGIFFKKQTHTHLLNSFIKTDKFESAQQFFKTMFRK